MEEFLISIFIIASSLSTYSWSYHVLWYQIDFLFQSIPKVNETKKLPQLDHWNTNKNEFIHKFYTEYSVSSQVLNKLIRMLFSYAMVCYLIVIEIVLWQITTADAEQKEGLITLWIWPLVLFSLTVILTTIQPFLILISVLDKFFNDKLEIEQLGAIAAGVIFILNMTMYYIEFGPFVHSNNLLTKLSVAGVSLLSILSAIATVSTIYYSFLMVWNKHNPTSLGIQNINTIGEKSLIWATDASIIEKINDYNKNIEENLEILKRLEAEPGGSQSVLRESLIEKIGWYQLEVNKLDSQRHESEFVRNIKKTFHVTFLLYCIHKLITTFISRVPYLIVHAFTHPDDYDYEYFDRNNKSNFGSDPLSVTLASILNFVLFRFNYEQDINALAKQISLLLSISLFGASFSTVITTISYISALLPIRFQVLALYTIQSNNDSYLPSSKSRSKRSSFRKEPSLIKNLFISELTGIYVISTVLTIRSNLPNEVSNKLNELLGQKFSIPNVVIDAWFYEVYATFCIIVFVATKVAEKIIYSDNHNN